VEALIACYAPAVEAYDLIKPLRYQGAAEVGKRVADWFASFQGVIEYEVRDLEVTAGEEAAFGYSLNHVVGTTVQGQPIDMWWRATICCAKIDRRWLISHEHSSVPFDMETLKAALDLKP
jgi:ketosteroid isomerase-like protein